MIVPLQLVIILFKTKFTNEPLKIEGEGGEEK